MELNPHQQEKEHDEKQKNTLSFQEFDNINIVNCSCPYIVFFTILGIIVKLLIGCSRQTNARSISGIKCLLNFWTFQVVFHGPNVVNKTIIQYFSRRINYRKPGVSYRQQSLQCVK